MSAIQLESMHKPPTASERNTLAVDGPCVGDAKAKILELECPPSSLNDASPVLNLPTEIVSEILGHFIPVYPKTPPFIGRSSPNVLAQICSRWREIALSTPSLWRALTLSAGNVRQLDYKLRLLEIWLQRSGSRPLSINMYGVNHTFLPALVAHSDRWEHLRMNAFNVNFPPIPTSLPSLRTLSLAVVGTAHGRLLHAAPLLRNIAVEYWNEHCFHLYPLSQLTAFAAGGMISPHHRLVLFEQAPNLVYCKLCLEPQTHHETGLSKKDARILPRLETLILERLPCADMPWNFLELFTLPALQRFQIGQPRVDGALAGLLQSLIFRSGCRIQELYIVPSDPRLAAYVPLELYRIALPTVGSILAGKLRITDPFNSDDEMDGNEEPNAHSDGESTGLIS
ncbi:hypothetical protein B0H16DRAFT_1890240 [Mycena metata]|uniref:F-box domain-containing protein n=1 Tax=Mycena metata TaxID=1033252 RepID=A0AAD7N1P9_9AGAR|nr:hypothetical protein B0H16DRAFT_1890240 [Mycena metata]